MRKTKINSMNENDHIEQVNHVEDEDTEQKPAAIVEDLDDLLTGINKLTKHDRETLFSLCHDLNILESYIKNEDNYNQVINNIDTAVNQYCELRRVLTNLRESILHAKDPIAKADKFKNVLDFYKSLPGSEKREFCQYMTNDVQFMIDESCALMNQSLGLLSATNSLKRKPQEKQ